MADVLTSDNELTWASFPIEKVEQTADGNVTVWGKATDDSLDSDQQIIDPDFAAKAMAEFFDSGPNIRVQHQPNRDPAGVGISYEKDGNAHWLKSRIIEPVAKQLVLGGALRAYSVGIARPTIQRDGVARGGRITDGQFVEISLVDRPANKNCGIQLVKGIDKSGQTVLMTKVFGAETLNKMDDAYHNGEVTVTLPHDVQVGFSPADLAKIVGRRNGNGFVAKAAAAREADRAVDSIDTLTKGKKKALRAAAAAAGVEADDGKSVTASGGPNIVGGSTTAKADEADEAVSAALAAAQHAQALDTDEKLAADGWIVTGKRKLTTEARNALPDSAFVFPEKRKYPIHDKNHARNALSRVETNGTDDEKAKVRAAVARKYPGIGKKTEKAGAAMNPAQAPPASMKKDKSLCGQCGAMQNRQHAFCTECGKAMMGAPEIAKNHDFMCLGCGRELDKGEKFCAGCGKANPGHNPMADMKIPANKADRSRVADDVTQTVTDQDGEQTVVKAKKPAKGDRRATKPGQMPGEDAGTYQAKAKGDRVASKPGQMPGEDAGTYQAKKGKSKPFGGNQAAPFGAKADGDAEAVEDRAAADAKRLRGSKKSADAPLTAAKSKNKPAKPVTTGSTPGAAGNAVSETGEHSVPGHREGDGHEFDRDASKSADPEVGTQMRLKSLGMDTIMGYAHDLSCAAFSWEDVAKSYPSGLNLLDANEWQQKALQAAANAPLEEAASASRLGQAVYAIKSAQLQDLVDVKTDLYKAFKDANPGPGSFPAPHELNAASYHRPQITAGRASYGAHYGSPHSAPIPPQGGMSAQNFHRQNIGGPQSVMPDSSKGRAPVPDPPGVVMNLDYSSINKEQIVAALDAMHNHFDRIFPGVCPLNGQLGRARHPVQAAKADDTTEVTKVSKDGLTSKQRKKLKIKLTRKVMKGKMSLDQARITMGKKPVTDPNPLRPIKTTEPDITKTEIVGSKDGLTRKDLRAVLAKSQKSTDKRLSELTSLVNALADQPDPGSQPWKGQAMNPMRTKSAAPAAVQSVAEHAERAQMMVMHQLEQTARNSTNPAEREAAWQSFNKMRGLIS